MNVMQTTAPAPFDRDDGSAPVRQIVMDFYDRALNSDLIGPYFEGIDMPRLIDHHTNFIAFVLGGSTGISDTELRAAHRHLGTGAAEFDEVNHS